MRQACSICGHVIIWQGILNPKWVHEDPVFEADHPGVYIQPDPTACCGKG